MREDSPLINYSTTHVSVLKDDVLSTIRIHFISKASSVVRGVAT